MAIHVESRPPAIKHPLSGLPSPLLLLCILFYPLHALIIDCPSLKQELNSEPVIPDGFPEWKDTMDTWGYKMISAVEVIHQYDPLFAYICFLCQLVEYLLSDVI